MRDAEVTGSLPRHEKTALSLDRKRDTQEEKESGALQRLGCKAPTNVKREGLALVG